MPTQLQYRILHKTTQTRKPVEFEIKMGMIEKTTLQLRMRVANRDKRQAYRILIMKTHSILKLLLKLSSVYQKEFRKPYEYALPDSVVYF